MTTAPDMQPLPFLPLTLPQALKMIADALNEPVDAVHPERTRESMVGWDSMGVLMLTAELDDRFGVELAADDSRKMQSVNDILEFLRAKKLMRN
jgi:acyl carrier protein